MSWIRLTGMIEIAADASRETVIATISQGLSEAFTRLDDGRRSSGEGNALGQIRVVLEPSETGVSITLEAEKVVSSLSMITGEEFKASRSLQRAMRRALR